MVVVHAEEATVLRAGRSDVQQQRAHHFVLTKAALIRLAEVVQVDGDGALKL